MRNTRYMNIRDSDECVVPAAQNKCSKITLSTKASLNFVEVEYKPSAVTRRKADREDRTHQEKFKLREILVPNTRFSGRGMRVPWDSILRHILR